MTIPRPATTRATRRGLLGAAALTPAAWLLSGCDGGTGPGPTGSGTRGAEGPQDPDQVLLQQVRAAVVDAEAFLVAVLAAHPGLARRLTGLRETHAAHLAALEDETTQPPGPAPSATPSPTSPVSPRDGVVPAGRRRALAAVRATERRYGDRLREAAASAASGLLARVLASASVGITMHLAALEPAPSDAGATGTRED